MVPLFGAAMFCQTFRYARKAELIHAHWSFSGIIAGMVGRLCNLPSITTLRGSDVRWASKNILFKTIIRWCVKMNQQVVTVGEDLADQVRHLVPDHRKRIKVIPNGVDKKFWSIQKEATFVSSITVIGNLIASKQVDVVIRAFEALIDLDNRLRLVIIGAGPEMKRLSALAHHLAIGERVVFTGQIPPNEVAEQLSRSSMLVLASKSEGRPNVVLEAMAAGVPVVASDIGGVRELIGNNERGLLFPVGDAGQLAERIKSIVVNPDFGSCIAIRASQWLREQDLSWERTAQRYSELYHQVIAEYSRRKGRRVCAE